MAAALSSAAGPTLQEESDEWVTAAWAGRPGQRRVTGGGRLPVRWVVHVVGPRYRGGQDNPGLLTQAVEAALDAAAGVGAPLGALPAISAGMFGYPRQGGVCCHRPSYLAVGTAQPGQARRGAPGRMGRLDHR